VSQLSRKCGSLDLSQPYWPSQPVEGITLPFFLNLHSGGGSKVHSTLRPLNGPLCQPRVIMIRTYHLHLQDGRVNQAGNQHEVIFASSLLHADFFIAYSLNLSRSQWPRCLGHELSSRVQTLGSWVRIPLKAWMSVCVYSVFVLGSGLATGWSFVQQVLSNVLD
jgi:hypothetical protein